MKKIALITALGGLAVMGFAQSSPIVVNSGYNFDGIANGSEANYASNLAAVQATTTGPLDGIYVFFEQGFLTDNPSYGLPVGGAFTSAGDGTNFQFGNYAANNVLLLNAAGTGLDNSGSLSFAGASYTSLSFLVDGFNGDQPGSFELDFSDGSNTIGNFTATDNFGNADNALSGFGRVSYQDAGEQVGNGEPTMFQINYTLSSQDAAKTLTSILFTNNETANDAGQNIAIWAISGQPQAVPAPSALLGFGVCGLALLARRRRA